MADTGAREIRFTIPGRMRGKGRHRVGIIGGHARAYSDEKTRSAEAMVRDFGYQAMAGQGGLLEGALHVSILVSVVRPASWTKRRIQENPIPTGKPDLDNVVKLIGDALNGVVWKDDSQIASLSACRQFVTDGERTEIVVEKINVPIAVAA